VAAVPVIRRDLQITKPTHRETKHFTAKTVVTSGITTTTTIAKNGSRTSTRLGAMGIVEEASRTVAMVEIIKETLADVVVITSATSDDFVTSDLFNLGKRLDFGIFFGKRKNSWLKKSHPF